MGVIASELLQGHHPAGNLDKVRRSCGKWRKWVESGERSLKELQSPRLQRVVERCLDPCPDSRPDAQEFLNEMCAELKLTYDLDVAQTLNLWRSDAYGDDPLAQNEHYAWAAAQSQRLGTKESADSREDISKRLQQANVVDFETCELWIPLAESFVCLAAGNADLLAEQDRIRKLASDYLVTILGTLDHSGVRQLPRRSDLPTVVREFERFSELVKRVADAAGIMTTHSSDFLQKLGPYARSALYFGWASDLRLQVGTDQVVMEMLSSAIAEAPSEPVNYYFRALWNDQFRHLWAFISSQDGVPEPPSIEKIAKDLEVAIRLDPDWREPKQLLESLRGRRAPSSTKWRASHAASQ
jgi:hypothetical protein